MNNKHRQRIAKAYKDNKGDSSGLFQVVLSEAKEIGLEPALAILEQCVIEKRMAWCDKNLADAERTGDPVVDGYRLFYEVYLGAAALSQGEIVSLSDTKIVMRWWNKCPTLEACLRFRLDTREICKKVYERPVQEFLSRINPGLVFSRNYECIRPYADYCEEIITLENTTANLERNESFFMSDVSSERIRKTDSELDK